MNKRAVVIWSGLEWRVVKVEKGISMAPSLMYEYGLRVGVFKRYINGGLGAHGINWAFQFSPKKWRLPKWVKDAKKRHSKYMWSSLQISLGGKAGRLFSARQRFYQHTRNLPPKWLKER